MKVSTYSDLRKNLKEQLDQVYDDKDMLIIKRKANRDVVILSLEEYNSLRETSYLLSSKANARRLFESMEQIERGEIKEFKTD